MSNSKEEKPKDQKLQSGKDKNKPWNSNPLLHSPDKFFVKIILKIWFIS